MHPIGGVPSQQRNALVALLLAAAVAQLPRVQQPIVVARMLEELEVLVAGGRREDALQGGAARQLVLGDHQRAHIVGRQVLEDGVLVLGGCGMEWKW